MVTNNPNSKSQWWDDFAPTYAKIELVNFQGGFSTFTLANCHRPGARILEVGCGSGAGTQIVSSSLMSREG